MFQKQRIPHFVSQCSLGLCLCAYVCVCWGMCASGNAPISIVKGSASILVAYHVNLISKFNIKHDIDLKTAL